MTIVGSVSKTPSTSAKRTLSPSCNSLRRTHKPPTYVPLVEFKSSTRKPLSSFTMMAWCAETALSAMTMLLSGRRPMVVTS